MAQLLRLGGHAERPRAGLHDDAGPRATRQPGYESVRPTPQRLPFEGVANDSAIGSLSYSAPWTVWDRAKVLAGGGGESLSKLVTDALRARVESLDAYDKRMAGDTTAIILEVEDPPKKLRFTVRLLATRGIASGADAFIYQILDGRVVYYEEGSPANTYQIHNSLDDLKEALDRAGSLERLEELLKEAYDSAGEEFLSILTDPSADGQCSQTRLL
jgi:hypothetical protein